MLAAMLGMGFSAFVSPNVGQAIPIQRTVGSPIRRGVFRSGAFSTTNLIGTRSAGGSVARDKRASVKTKNRKTNRRHHV
jgi:hypothetical protein